MANELVTAGDTFSVPANADLSDKQYYCATINSSGKAAITAAAGGRVDGILANAPAAADRSAVLQDKGTAKCVAAGAVTAGNLVVATAAGKVDDTGVAGKVDTSDAGAASDPVIGSYVVGVALESAAADGDIISVRLRLGGVIPGTVA